MSISGFWLRSFLLGLRSRKQRSFPERFSELWSIVASSRRLLNFQKAIGSGGLVRSDGSSTTRFRSRRQSP